MLRRRDTDVERRHREAQRAAARQHRRAVRWGFLGALVAALGASIPVIIYQESKEKDPVPSDEALGVQVWSEGREAAERIGAIQKFIVPANPSTVFATASEIGADCGYWDVADRLGGTRVDYGPVIELEGRGSEAVHLTSIRVVPEEAGTPPTNGSLLDCADGFGGANEYIMAAAVLDGSRLEPLVAYYGPEAKELDGLTYNLSGGEVLRIGLYVRARDCLCTYRVVAEGTYRNQPFELVIDEAGQPFSVASPPADTTNMAYLLWSSDTRQWALAEEPAALFELLKEVRYTY